MTFLTEEGEGMVTGLLGAGKVTVRVEEGMEIPYSVGDLLPVDRQKREELMKEVSGLPRLKEEDVRIRRKVQDVSNARWEIDLHLDALVDRHRGLTPSHMLEIQLRHLRAFMTDAMEARATRVVIIHGVGEGVLKNEVIHYLSGLANISYYDASYRRYGKGATEVEIRYPGPRR